MRFLVSGLINIETTARIDGFPLNYAPVRYAFGGVNMRASGVGYNLAKALTHLGNTVDFLSLIGNDPARLIVENALTHDHINPHLVLPQLANTPQSVILYDDRGQRMIHVDLKDIQEQTYPTDHFQNALERCEVAVLCNINFSRGMLEQARQANKLIATDVHAIHHLDDPYNSDFMRFAHIVFQSHEHLPMPPHEWAHALMARYQTDIVGIGLGEQGALLAVRHDNRLVHIPSVSTRPIVNTIGAGDALFSAFLHTYAQTKDPYLAMEKAVVFASYKIGSVSASEGFLSHDDLDMWFQRTR